MSAKLEYSNNSMVLRGFDKKSEQYEKFTKSLSSWDQVTHKYVNPIYQVYNGDIYLPKSLGIDYVKYYFKDVEVEHNPNMISKSRNINYNMKNQPRDDVQKAAINFITGVTSDKYSKDRFLTLNTGDGKTFVTIYSLSNIQKVPMIVVDATDLAEQWKKEFVKHTDLSERDICIISGKDSIKKAVETKYKAKVYIAMHRTLQMLVQNAPDKLPSLYNMLGIGVRVFDECHLEFHNICRINSFSNVEYSIYLTATPNRSKFSDDKMYNKIFGSMRVFNGKIQNNERYHVIYNVDINTKPNIKQQAKAKTRYGFNKAGWTDYLIEDRYDFLLENLKWIIDRLDVIDKKMQTAIVFPSIALIEKLHKDLQDHYKMKIGKFIGSVPKKNRARELSYPIIFTNEKIFNKGIDVKGLECMIVYSSLSTDNNIEQLIGRIRYGEEKRHIYVDVTDNGFPALVNHYKKRRTYYNKTSKMIVNCDEVFEYTGE